MDPIDYEAAPADSTAPDTRSFDDILGSLSNTVGGLTNTATGLINALKGPKTTVPNTSTAKTPTWMPWAIGAGAIGLVLLIVSMVRGK